MSFILVAALKEVTAKFLLDPHPVEHIVFFQLNYTYVHRSTPFQIENAVFSELKKECNRALYMIHLLTDVGVMVMYNRYMTDPSTAHRIELIVRCINSWLNQKLANDKNYEGIQSAKIEYVITKPLNLLPEY